MSRSGSNGFGNAGRRPWLAGLILLVGGIAMAATDVLWQETFAEAKPGALTAGAVVVADPQATGGQAVELTFAKAGGLPPVARARDLVLAGTGTLRVWVRGKDLNNVANGLRLTVMLDRQTTPSERFEATGAVYGVRTGGDTWRLLSIPFVVGDTPASYLVQVVPTWQAQTGDRQPTVWIDRLELVGRTRDAPYIAGLLRGRTMYAPGERVEIAVSLVNPTAVPFRGKVVAEDCFGLTGRRVAATEKVAVPAGERQVVAVTWKARAPEVGHEIRFALEDRDGQVLDRDWIDVGIAANPMTLNYPTHDFASGKHHGMPFNPFYVWPESRTQRLRVVELGMRDRSNRCGRWEVFGWSWGDLAGFISPEDPFMRTFDARWLSLKTYRDRIELAKATGTHVQSYILGCAAEEAGYRLYQDHPEWFMYDRNGEVGGYDLEAHARDARRHEFEFMPIRKNKFMASLDPTNPEVRRWIADQIVRLGTDMGFQGCRWDVWWMNVAPGNYRFDGTEIAPTIEMADRLSAESLRALKAMVARELPNFTWGYNCASLEENRDYPQRLAEMCKGRAWMLDEVSYQYDAPTSPYHFWDAYRKRMIEWGDHIRQLDGIYDPWIFNRESFDATKHIEADWLHANIFRMLSGGRVWLALYRNDSALVGDLPRLAYRYSDIYSGWNLRLQPEDQTRIAVDAPDTLWWKGSVLTNRSIDGDDQAIVHLVNSPVTGEIGNNKESRVRPPVVNTKVTCRAAARGKLPERAWLLTAEPLTPEGEPEVQAVALPLTRAGDAVTVTVPAVLYLKTVVFED